MAQDAEPRRDGDEPARRFPLSDEDAAAGARRVNLPQPPKGRLGPETAEAQDDAVGR